ncbi:MAG: SUMF1/EgtB/PvdO family nonheme iron enzyme [Armatimonadetes bacterium]|nr:SUMF1/EgtB/PvdO family nonheme iron enzyme [Armatimonadota bacterium]
MTMPYRARTALLPWLLPLLAALPAAARAADEFTLEARDFDDGNAQVSLTGQAYADGPSCIWNGGELPNRAEYVLALPVTADYTLWALFTAAASRPVDISVDGAKVHTGLTGVTGSWNTSSAQWERQCTAHLERGTHTFELTCAGPYPHICALRFVSSEPFPAGWQLARLSPDERAERMRLRQAKTRAEESIALLQSVDPEAVALAIDDLERDFAGRYDGAAHRQALARFVGERAALLKSLADGQAVEPAAVEQALAGVRTALLANPLLDGDRLMVVRRNFAGNAARSVTGGDAGFVPANYLSHASMARTGWDNEVAVLTGLRDRPKLERLYQPASGRILRDVRLDWSGERLLFSSIDDKGRWAVFQMRADGAALEQMSPTAYPDVDYFDACWLPNGKVVLCSTANYQGLPCLDGAEPIASLYLLDPATRGLRQLTFDQDSDNDPTVLNDGRVLYQRWEYGDIPHYFARRLMCMNPDGTSQTALYGRNSWFPTAFRFAQPVPDHPTRVVGVISGHHDFGDCGRLALIDPALGSGYPFRFHPSSKEWGVEGQPIAVTPEVLPAERTGLLQLIPGRGKVVPGTVCDAIVTDVYRKERPALTTHPCPLSSKYYLVSMKPTPHSLWGIYLVDVFDNATLIAETEGAALFEPQPLTARRRPPVIPDRIAPTSRTAEVQIQDIYSGPGLRGVPRGTVKRLRVFAYHFGYMKKAGFPLIGTQAGWDVKRILGTAAVEADGSACFQIPANTPVSIQPLDGEGRAVQWMRSWLVGMPGEAVSCVGCHEQRMATAPVKPSRALDRGCEPLQPWYGPPRPFAFAAEVYPVLEQYCGGCHQQAPMVGPRSRPCFSDPDTAYNTLHPYIHRGGVESDMDLLTPMEYHASTSVLIQMLEKGHHGVKLAALSREARERLYCWIDLNVPRAGNWDPPAWQDQDQRQRRRELSVVFANNSADPEGEYQAAQAAFAGRTPTPFAMPPADGPAEPDGLHARGFPLTADEARQRQAAGPAGARRTVDLGGGCTMTFAWIPAGEFVMGRLDGAPDERPRSVVRIDQPFWMSVTEVTNGQFARFDPDHDTRYVDMHYMDHTVPGHIANHPDQPVARVSWTEAAGFCRWLGRRTGLAADLPTEAQWEWAARAGTETPFFYGTMDTEFGGYANLADQSLRWYRMGFDGPSALPRRYEYPPEMNFPLHDERFRDHWHVVDYVGQTEPNSWGLQDVVGNVGEWTRSSYRAYLYAEDGRNDADSAGRRVVRGGSWADRPADAGSSVRRAFEPWQKVYDVGFRVLLAP